MLKDLALLSLRLTTGSIVAAHGYTKLFGGPGRKPPEKVAELLGPNFSKAVEQGGPEAFAQVLTSLGIPQPQAAAYMSGATEFLGGLAIVLGLKTRLVAPLVVFNLLVAIEKVHRKNGFYGEGGFELPGLLATNVAALFIAGPGCISFDTILRDPPPKPAAED